MIPAKRRVVVFTAITGGYDTLPPVPDAWRSAADFIAFVDDPPEGTGWEVRAPQRPYSDPTRNARMHKILGHRLLPGYDLSIWVDGSVQITSVTPLPDLIEDWLSAHDIALFRHRARTCVYAEAEACITAAKDAPELIRAQMDHYRASGYPAGNGLHETMVLVRRHSPAVFRFNDDWHRELERFSRRDQLSLDVVLHRHRLPVRTLAGTIARNEHFQWRPHRNASAALAFGPDAAV